MARKTGLDHRKDYPGMNDDDMHSGSDNGLTSGAKKFYSRYYFGFKDHGISGRRDWTSVGVGVLVKGELCGRIRIWFKIY